MINTIVISLIVVVTFFITVLISVFIFRKIHGRSEGAIEYNYEDLPEEYKLNIEVLIKEIDASIKDKDILLSKSVKNIYKNREQAMFFLDVYMHILMQEWVKNNVEKQEVIRGIINFSTNSFSRIDKEHISDIFYIIYKFTKKVFFSFPDEGIEFVSIIILGSVCSNLYLKNEENESLEYFSDRVVERNKNDSLIMFIKSIRYPTTTKDFEIMKSFVAVIYVISPRFNGVLFGDKISQLASVIYETKQNESLASIKALVVEYSRKCFIESCQDDVIPKIPEYIYDDLFMYVFHMLKSEDYQMALSHKLQNYIV